LVTRSQQRILDRRSIHNNTLTTLADARTLIAKHLPEHFRDKQSWRHVAAELDKAAAGGDTAEPSLALRMALSLEGVECRPQ
jgi:hypothetical protein